MVTLAENESANVVALMEVLPEEVEKYGIATISGIVGESTFGKCLINSLVEKPRPELAPSRLAVVGRYVLQPGVFEILENTEPGVSGEIQLTDALDLMARNPQIAGPVYGYVIRGRRFDMGNQLSYLKAVIELASERSDIGMQLKSWLKEFSQD
jgi:UTP--glucose-1-phosphate uridylyltransferase